MVTKRAKARRARDERKQTKIASRKLAKRQLFYEPESEEEEEAKSEGEDQNEEADTDDLQIDAAAKELRDSTLDEEKVGRPAKEVLESEKPNQSHTEEGQGRKESKSSTPEEAVIDTSKLDAMVETISQDILLQSTIALQPDTLQSKGKKSDCSHF